MKILKKLFLTILVACAVSIPVFANSTGISCVLEDLDDSLGDGGDLWQATYTLDSLIWQTGVVEPEYVLAIKFGTPFYQSIEWVDNDLNDSMWVPDYWLPGTISEAYYEELFFTNAIALIVRAITIEEQ